MTETATPKTEPVCTSRMENQILRGAKTLGNAQTQTSAVADFTLPTDPEELERMNHMAILAVTVFTHQIESLPVEKVLFIPKKGGPATRLPGIFPKFPVSTLDESSPINRMLGQKLGKFRQDLYVFVPIRLLRSEGKLIVTLKKGLNSLPLGDLPLSFDESLIPEKPPEKYEDPKRLPDPKLTLALLAKEYCLGQTSALEHTQK